METLKVMITGHRPNKLGGYHKSNPRKLNIERKLRDVLTRIKTSANKKGKQPIAISGMALGVDQWWAEAALYQGIPCHAYVPFKGQETKWPKESQTYYTELLTRCDKEITVCPEGYAAWKMHKRDRAMVNDADICIAVWDGEPGGGTANTVNFIRQSGKPCLIINSSTLEEQWENS